MKRITTALTALAAVAGVACDPGDIIIVDGFAPDSDSADVLHPWATGGKVKLKVLPVGDFDMSRLGDPEVEGAISLDPDEDISGGGTLTFGVLTDDEPGTATIRIVDKDGNDVGEARDVDVRAADELRLTVTAPLRPDLDLPEVDPRAVHVYAGEVAAFRTELFADGDAIFALESVVADGELGPGRACLACADDTCEATRAALEFSASSIDTTPKTATLTSGTASLALTIIPVLPEEVTDLVLDQGDTFEGKKSVVALVVKDDVPVFGAPVVWNIDGEAFTGEDSDIPQEGDVLQYKPGNARHDVEATLGEFALTVPVQGDDFEVSAITFACGAQASSALPLSLLGGLLLWRRRRR